jgi:type IV secretion system protein VirB10
MFDGISVKPEGIKKINKNLVVVTAGALLLATVVLFGIESERAKKPALAQTKKEPPAAVSERVNVESFNALPQNYAFIQGLASKKDAQTLPQGQQTTDAQQRPANQPPTAQQVQEEVGRKLEDEARTNSKIFFSEAGQGATSSQQQAAAPQGAPTSSSTRDTELSKTLASIPGATSQQDPTGQREKRSFYNDETAQKELATYVKHAVKDPLSPYEVMAGTVLPAVLITGIDSDLPGQVIAQIRENVYDTATGRYLLIPQGTRVIGTYDNMISWSQDRVMQIWSRLVFPDGSSILLDGMPGADLSGKSGLGDAVDYHYGKLAYAVLLSAFTSLGATSYGGNVDGYYPTLRQQVGMGVGMDVNRAGQRIVDRQLNVAPTIQVRPGFKFTVMVNKDVVLRPYGNNE